MPENEYRDILSSSLEKIKSFAETDSAIGEPILLPSGVTLLPISKVSMGLATGGIGFGEKKERQMQQRRRNFTAGGGSGVSITPIAFLVIGNDGNYDLLSIRDPSESDSVDKIATIIEKTPNILKKIKNVVLEKQEKTEI